MSEDKHTPGPWRYWNKLSLSENDQGFTLGDSNGRWLGDISPRSANGIEGKANACLITAAPDLLAACKDLYTRLDGLYDVDEESGTGKLTEYPYAGAGADMQLLERVIAKAIGDSK